MYIRSREQDQEREVRKNGIDEYIRELRPVKYGIV
jgi:hypothetical protein